MNKNYKVGDKVIIDPDKSHPTWRTQKRNSFVSAMDKYIGLPCRITKIHDQTSQWFKVQLLNSKKDLLAKTPINFFVFHHQ